MVGVSVVIPCFNQGKYLSKALDSLLQQSYSDWEAIMVNDGSSDDTQAIALKYVATDSRFRYFYQKNGGASSARNNGIKNAIGKYIVFLDSDDWLSPDALMYSYEQMERDEKIAMVYLKYAIVDDKTEEIKEGPIYGGYENLLLFGQSNTAMIKREKAIECHLFDENMKSGAEDWEFYVRYLYKNQNVTISDKILYYYRSFTDEKRISKQAGKHIQEISSYIYKKNYDIYVEFFGSPIYLIRKNKSYYWADRRLAKLAKNIQESWQRIYNLVVR